MVLLEFAHVTDFVHDSSPTSKRKKSGIAKWPEDERPREGLLARGPLDLTDGEFAILLRVGVQGKSSVELGHDLVKRLTQRSIGTYFQYLREGRIVDYRSELDVKLAEGE